jgi:hypothetical protein
MIARGARTRAVCAPTTASFYGRQSGASGRKLLPMRTWMLPWLFPVGLLGSVVFVVLAGRYVALITVALGVLVVVPVLWRVNFRPRGDGESDDASYWRTKAL